ncbi:MULTISPECIES: hypothetical protein [Kribbella]|uniref:DUF4177 domain-containing protein n=1 Tax=Kribbella karoonensis TaxID=324851 RepID=A0ABN2DLK5_9ACTN
MSQMRAPRIFQAPKILSGEISLINHPLRYVVVASRGLGDESLDELLTIVEVEEQRGWELVNITRTDVQYMAFIRRR